jgi:hypothetical protein
MQRYGGSLRPSDTWALGGGKVLTKALLKKSLRRVSDRTGISSAKLADAAWKAHKQKKTAVVSKKQAPPIPATPEDERSGARVAGIKLKTKGVGKGVPAG